MPSPISRFLSSLAAPEQWPADLSMNGQVKPEWQHLLQAVQHLGADELHSIAGYVVDNIQTRSLIYNVHSVQNSQDSWDELSALPFVITEQEWSQIEAACAQRATLLNRILQDIYGPQELVQHCLIPPSLVYGQRGYLWPCHNALNIDACYLPLYAMDLVRTVDGQWRVIKDRTDCPVGIGYAMQNRQVQGAALTDVYNQMQVKPQSAFYRALQQQLQGVALSLEDEVKPADVVAVLLSSGPKDPAYFEQLFLSRQMGIALVESADLTLRDEQLYLKTLRGLQRVHIILRYLDDNECDPLELGGVDYQGVPGLLQAIRRKKVKLMNALGSGVLESAGMLEFLPAINQHYYGEDLLIPSVRSWWCGESSNLQEVLEQFDHLIIKSSYASQSQKYWYIPELSEPERQELRQKLLESPRTYEANEVIQAGAVPEFVDKHNQQLAMYPFTLRVYAVAKPEGGYEVMAGGVVRVSDNSSPVMTLKNRHANKDVWVCQQCIRASQEQHQAEGTQSAKQAAELNVNLPLSYQDLLVRETNVPSRMGENLFWLGRYAMRIEHSVLLFRSMMQALSERNAEQESLVLTLYQMAGALDIMPTITQALAPNEVVGFIQEQLKNCLGPSIRPNSLYRNVFSLHHCAYQVRNKLSSDTWWLLSQFPSLLETGEPSLSKVRGQIQKIYSSCSILSGFTHEQMTRDDGWSFLLMARIMEKLMRMSDTLLFFLNSSARQKEIQLNSLLHIAYSSVTYRTRYHREAEILAVLYLLIFDESNPYSLLFLARQFVEHSRRFQVPNNEDVETVEQFIEHLALVDLSYFDVHSVRAQRVYIQLAKLCRELSAAMSGFTTKLSGQYFLLNEMRTSGFGKDLMNKEYL